MRIRFTNTIFSQVQIEQDLGKVLAYNKNKTKKNPIVPTKMLMSTKVGENIVHDDGK